MRLRSVWISDYKNLKDFSIIFEGNGFIDIFVGKNGSGKSNFQEALIAIFDHLFDFDPAETGPAFDYELSFEIVGVGTTLKWRGGLLSINGEEGRRSLGQTSMPDHVLVYYSGHNPNVGGLIDKYEERFERKIDGPGFADSPKIIAITEELKDLFLAMMLLLPENDVGRQALIKRLGIKTVRSEIRVVLQRPVYARGRNAAQFEVDDLQGKRYWNPRGATGDFLARLESCFSAGSDRGPIRTEGYQAETDAYFLFLDLEKLRAEFAGDGICSLFRQFYSLKILEMLASISVEVELESGYKGGTSGFSDGQFQMVYMLASAELFKDRNIVSLFDEPDAFLHPEWQFEFLNQIDAISAQAARTNHILLNSHSASTIAANAPVRIRLFTSSAAGVSILHPDKSDLINSLSAGLITFSEQEATLGINQIIEGTSGPVLFTEGPSDAEILRFAWNALHPGQKAPFAIEAGYGKNFIRNLLTSPQIYATHPGRPFFALFDFDDAYSEWQNFRTTMETDPTKCLAGRWEGRPGYGLLLPVPAESTIVGQVLKANGTGHFKERSRLSIELMFRDVPGLEDHFEVDPDERDGCIRFKGNKMRFATVTVPSLGTEHFACFQPIFDFVIAHSHLPEEA
jgi:energy-coupling factor transporter ATP-binding protein EcfA2